ncbi:hypothetical protein MOQ_005293 [Trypanosoma cruzi marinkellei]|uniref:Secreted protein n=1 Tax=Trypanosoma cruzi marinkellei TaxID=85056 RepID=K2N7Y7_TRYCR|nr:hypothetical protein MOQ_005293 [Trypanosoma cruzi marinkellei]
MCVVCVCLLFFLLEPSNFTVAIRAQSYFASFFVCLHKKCGESKPRKRSTASCNKETVYTNSSCSGPHHRRNHTEGRERVCGYVLIAGTGTAGGVRCGNARRVPARRATPAPSKATTQGEEEWPHEQATPSRMANVVLPRQPASRTMQKNVPHASIRWHRDSHHRRARSSLTMSTWKPRDAQSPSSHRQELPAELHANACVCVCFLKKQKRKARGAHQLSKRRGWLAATPAVRLCQYSRTVAAHTPSTTK